MERWGFQRRGAEAQSWREGMNRVEHIERVEDSEKGLSHKVHKEHKGDLGDGVSPHTPKAS